MPCRGPEGSGGYLLGRILLDSDAVAPAPTMSLHGTLVQVDFFVLMELPATRALVTSPWGPA